MKNKILFLFSFLLFSSSVFADEIVKICYGYGCLAQKEIIILEAELKPLVFKIQSAENAESERQKIANVIGQLYQIAGRQTPIFQDKAGNFNDPPSGKMDCIDHSTTTDRFLKILEKRGAFKWHKIAPIQKRFFAFLFLSHYSAAIAEKNAENQIFVVDSWFVDHGESAIILPLAEWKNGGGPDV